MGGGFASEVSPYLTHSAGVPMAVSVLAVARSAVGPCHLCWAKPFAMKVSADPLAALFQPVSLELSLCLNWTETLWVHLGWRFQVWSHFLLAQAARYSACNLLPLCWEESQTFGEPCSEPSASVCQISDAGFFLSVFQTVCCKCHMAPKWSPQWKCRMWSEPWD